MKIACAALLFAMTVSPVFAQTQEEADAKFAAEDWQGAADEYRALLDTDAENAQNWFNLGQALHHVEDYKNAVKAYQSAIDAGYARVPQARYHMARAYMSLGKEKDALKQLEEIAKTGGPPAGIIKSTAEFQPLAENERFIAVVTALTPCRTEEYRQFDFWLGEWDVTPAGAEQPQATNKITSAHNGCAVVENYDSGGFTGMSVNFYDNKLERWRQTWISNQGAPLYLSGGLDESGAMVMSDEGLASSEASGVINRITWSANDDGAVRQHWEQSSDGGENWKTVFDGLYTKKK